MHCYDGIYGTVKCTSCHHPFKEHGQGPLFLCPRFSTPETIRRQWESYGTRKPHAHVDGCPCALCVHS